MQDAPWQDEVAQLLEVAAQALRDKVERRAVRSFGTAIAYLQIARESGDKFATELLNHAFENAKEGPTERFTFQPGELEALSTRDEKPARDTTRPPARDTTRPPKKKRK